MNKRICNEGIERETTVDEGSWWKRKTYRRKKLTSGTV
jgi:hypothetical protein